MKHITEATDEEIEAVLDEHADENAHLVPWAIPRILRAAFDFTPAPQPTEGVAELIARVERDFPNFTLNAQGRTTRDDVLKALEALSRPLPVGDTPSDEEAHNGDELEALHAVGTIVRDATGMCHLGTNSGWQPIKPTNTDPGVLSQYSFGGVAFPATVIHRAVAALSTPKGN